MASCDNKLSLAFIGEGGGKGAGKGHQLLFSA